MSQLEHLVSRPTFELLLRCFSGRPTTCRNTALGTDYMGTLNRTGSGKTCQAWISQSPHKHRYSNHTGYSDGSAALAKNYCRNPDSWKGGLYCYTTDPAKSWELCSVPYCIGELLCAYFLFLV